MFEHMSEHFTDGTDAAVRGTLWLQAVDVQSSTRTKPNVVL